MANVRMFLMALYHTIEDEANTAISGLKEGKPELAIKFLQMVIRRDYLGFKLDTKLGKKDKKEALHSPTEIRRIEDQIITLELKVEAQAREAFSLIEIRGKKKAPAKKDIKKAIELLEAIRAEAHVVFVREYQEERAERVA